MACTHRDYHLVWFAFTNDNQGWSETIKYRAYRAYPIAFTHVQLLVEFVLQDTYGISLIAGCRIRLTLTNVTFFNLIFVLTIMLSGGCQI